MSAPADERRFDGPHCFVADLERPVLDDDDRHHVARVLRVRPGDELSVSDGRGRWRPCRFGDELEPDGAIAFVPAPEPALTVAFALVKGDRPELVVQKLTELGIDRIVPISADRSVVRWDGDKAAKQHARLRKVAREAAMQSRRCWIPEVAPTTTVTALAGAEPVTRADRVGHPPTLDRTTVLIGPEGGWSPGERAEVADATAFGDHVLRSETAAITAGAILVALRSGLVSRHN